MSYRAGGTSEHDGAATTQPWKAFASGADLQPGHDWYNQKVPVELQTDANLPEKLERILAWSLIQGCPPSTSATQADPPTTRQEPEQPDSTSTTVERTDSTVNEESARQSVPTQENGSEHRPALHPSLPVRALEKISRPQWRRHQAQHYSISQGVFTSTLDLINTFKTRADREANTTTSIVQSSPSVECVSCFEDFPPADTAKLSCTHSYCKPCLRKLVMNALQNESSFPPKCCLTEIPLQTSLLPLDKKQRESYRDKAAEYAIPAQERWYCPNTKCSKWISPRKVSRLVHFNQRCPHCSTRICNTCRGTAHRGLSECPQDYGLEATLSLAEEEGWRRCFKCRALVERSEGCRHMTCKCGAQFCYYCGVKWRTCLCTDVEENRRIIDTRRRRDARDAAAAEEAEEIARIIAEVEAMEQREAEQHQREVERLTAERQKEEDHLRRLELERLEEQERRRVQREKEEEELQQTLRLSVQEQLQELQSVFTELMKAQKLALDNKHMHGEQAQATEYEDYTNRQNKDNEMLVAKMTANISKRTASMEEKQKSERSAHEADQEKAEDEMFLQIQIHLQGKPNKDMRERRLRDQFTAQRNQRLDAIETRFDSEKDSLKQNAAVELEILKRNSEAKLAGIRARRDHDLERLVAVVATDRAWFDYLSERRRNMLLANSGLMLEAVDKKQEPLGLTEEVALTIGPFFGEEDIGRSVKKDQSSQMLVAPSPASSVTGSPAPSFVELAENAQALLQNLSSASSSNNVLVAHPNSMRSDHLSKNEAWNFMMGASSAKTNTGALPSSRLQQRSQISTATQQSVPKRLSVSQTTQVPYEGSVAMSGALPVSQPPTSIQHHRGKRSLPPVPSLYLPSSEPHHTGDITLTSSQRRQAHHNSISSASSVASSAQDDHKFIVIPSLHTRQSSADSSGTMISDSLTSMSSLDSRSPLSVRSSNESGPLPADTKVQSGRMWSFRNLRRKGPDRYTDEEIKEKMKTAVGDAFYC